MLVDVRSAPYVRRGVALGSAIVIIAAVGASAVRAAARGSCGVAAAPQGVSVEEDSERH